MSHFSNLLIKQFLRFGIVGFASFSVTTAVIYATKSILGPAAAGIPGFLAGVSTGWVLNRRWTFQYKSKEPLWYQWLHYVAWTAPSLALNSVTYEVSVLTSEFAYSHPIVGSALGSIAGMLVSFAVMRLFVFKT